jgi:ubiquinone/menaquinone biosynthesis C-methylase UbiE
MNRHYDDEKQRVKSFWNQASCGENLYLSKSDQSGYEAQSEMRYLLEPFILSFGDFISTKGMRVLEIGVGLGADHQKLAEAGAELYGVDLTERAINHTRHRLKLFGLSSILSVGDAENLNFQNESFDYVYSWGVLHHSPDTPKAISEVHRVLKPQGIAKIMIYHKWSIVGVMLWLRYALLAGNPFRSLSDIYAYYLESPGTKAYSVADARKLFSEFNEVKISIQLCHGDLLESNAGQRHRGFALSIAKQLLPRRLIRRFFPSAGLFMMIEVRK